MKRVSLFGFTASAMQKKGEHLVIGGFNAECDRCRDPIEALQCDCFEVACWNISRNELEEIIQQLKTILNSFNGDDIPEKFMVLYQNLMQLYGVEEVIQEKE